MKKDKLFIFLLLLFAILYMIPYMLNGNNSFIVIHDNLDCSFAHLKMIQKGMAIFNYDQTLPIFGGLPRSAIPFSSPFELKSFISYLIPGIYGIFINIFLIKLIASIGMFLFLRNYVLKDDLYAFVISVIFALIPFYPNYGISSAGIPLLTYSLLNLERNLNVIRNLIAVLLYAIYSSLALSGLFVCFLLILWIISLYFEKRKINKNLLLAWSIMVIAYTLVNWAMIVSFFSNSAFISHRLEWNQSGNLFDFGNIIFNFFYIVLQSQYHAGSFEAYLIIIPFFFVCIKYRNDRSLLPYLASFFTLISLVLVGALSVFLPFHIFTTFQFDRFYFFYPALCFIILAKCIAILSKHKKQLGSVVFLVLSSISVTISNKDYMMNIASSIGVNLKSATFRSFYAEDLFKSFSKDYNICLDYTVKVVSLGMYPSIAEYNGLWCLDGYINSYPLDYKHKFRKVISNELGKDTALKSYFDDWGSRCYVFSVELKDQGNQYLCSKEDNLSIEHLDIDTKALKDLGCQYVISAVDIKNYKELNLDSVNAYTTPDSYWNIRVYRVI